MFSRFSMVRKFMRYVAVDTYLEPNPSGWNFCLIDVEPIIPMEALMLNDRLAIQNT